jgi:ferredoxin--NADP+ reductase
VPFDDARGTIRNDRGRVLDDAGEHVAATYCAGWIKRGPTGIIGTNKKDATETVELLLEDVRAGLLAHDAGKTAEAADALLDERGARRIVYTGWQAIDAFERSRGEPLGRPRVKLVTWNELLDAAEAVAAET